MAKQRKKKSNRSSTKKKPTHQVTTKVTSPQQYSDGDDTFRAVHFVTYDITDEPLDQPYTKDMPQQVKDEISDIYQMLPKRPYQAIGRLLPLIDKYPHSPILYNHLSVAYAYNDQPDLAEKVIRRNYRNNPDYLFARISYAELCLHAGEYDKIPEIFDHKYNLKLLYPERDVFHISEVVNFMAILGIYFYGIGERKTAEQFYEPIKKMGRSFEATKALKKMLYPGLKQRIILRILKFLEDKAGPPPT
jgi:tetratricopeptide (TPR) repeat protein